MLYNKSLISKTALRQLLYSGFLVPKSVFVTLRKAPFFGNIAYIAEQLSLH